VDIFHVVSRRDSAYNELNQQGGLGFRRSDRCNAIPVCPTCHVNFDDTHNPGLVFFPADLDYFVDSEEHD
jgi:hypothetical protein